LRLKVLAVLRLHQCHFSRQEVDIIRCAFGPDVQNSQLREFGGVRQLTRHEPEDQSGDESSGCSHEFTSVGGGSAGGRKVSSCLAASTARRCIPESEALH